MVHLQPLLSFLLGKNRNPVRMTVRRRCPILSNYLYLAISFLLWLMLPNSLPIREKVPDNRKVFCPNSGRPNRIDPNRTLQLRTCSPIIYGIDVQCRRLFSPTHWQNQSSSEAIKPYCTQALQQQQTWYNNNTKMIFKANNKNNYSAYNRIAAAQAQWHAASSPP